MNIAAQNYTVPIVIGFSDAQREGISMTIKVGSASWRDQTLIASKRFYPPGCTSAEARLRFYAMQLPLVEVDSSYYAIPSASNSAR